MTSSVARPRLRGFLVALLFGLAAALPLAAVPIPVEPHPPVAPGQLYNTANAAARAGDFGTAILLYERALALDPRFSEAAANLAFVRRQADLPTPPSGTLLNWARRLPLRHWLALGATGGWLLVAAVIALALRWLPRPAAFAGGLIGLALLGAASPALLGYHLDRDAVIVLDDASPLRLAPAPSSDTTATARMGERAVRLGTHGLYAEIRLPDGRRGWIHIDHIGSVWER